MSVTTNLAEFGSRERNMAEELLHAWNTSGLPRDFDDSGVVIAMNTYSGNVFLTNEDYQVAMMNGDDLESWYFTPHDGREGFYDELMDDYDDMHPDDQEYMDDIKENR